MTFTLTKVYFAKRAQKKNNPLRNKRLFVIKKNSNTKSISQYIHIYKFKKKTHTHTPNSPKFNRIKAEAR